MNVIKFDGADVTPSKVVCVGRNYVEHIKELNNDTPTEPVIFNKPNSAITNEIYTSHTEEIHYEGEICFLIKSGQIAGVGFGLDLTKRTVQSELKERGLPWERAKAFDKSAVFSEFLVCDSDVTQLSMELSINGLLKQQATYELMIYKPEQLLRDIQTFLTLEDGDIIMTGTPKGVGIVNSGDVFEAKILSGEHVLISRSWHVK